MSWKRSTALFTRSAASADYAFAIATTSIAILVTLLATRWLEDFPLLILVTAVMASALRGGTGPGLVAMTLSGLAIFVAAHFFASRFAIPPVNASDEIVRLVIFVVVATGISLLAGARRRAERERDVLLVREKAAREEAEAANAAKDRFLAAVSHELRNPLAAILSWSSLARTATDEATIRRAFEATERNAKSLARLVEDLLDVSRIVTGTFRLEPRAVDPVPVVAAAIETVAAAAESKHITVDRVVDPGAVLVRADPDRLQQIVWNLVANAVKFTPEHGRVSVHVTYTVDHVEIRVTDTGRGIGPEVLPHVFEPFWQAEVGDRRMGGLGLGLGIVRHLVELHGGTVAARSAGIGRGASFTVTLPLIPSGRTMPVEPPVRQERPQIEQRAHSPGA